MDSWEKRVLHATTRKYPKIWPRSLWMTPPSDQTEVQSIWDDYNYVQKYPHISRISGVHTDTTRSQIWSLWFMLIKEKKVNVTDLTAQTIKMCMISIFTKIKLYCTTEYVWTYFVFRLTLLYIIVHLLFKISEITVKRSRI